MVSVVMPTYNQARFIREALTSILWQVHPDWELIIVNDGCTDQTQQVIASCARDFRGQGWEKVHQVRTQHMGYTQATNLGLSHARGEYETMVSSDNIYFRAFLSELVPILDQRPQVGFVYSDFQYIDEKGNIGRAWLRPAWTRGIFLTGYHAGICMLWRKDLREQIGGFDETLLAADYDFILKCEEHADCFHVPKILGYYRDHPETVSRKRGGATDDAEIRSRALQRRGLSPET